MFIESFQDTTLIVLIVAAVVSFAVGLYEDPTKGWIEGAAILFAVLLVAVVTATNNFNKESQFRKLNAVKDDIKVGIKRNGVATSLDVKELVSFCSSVLANFILFCILLRWSETL
jgi:magnesium-transporting ATPase (P-type)